MFVQLFELVLWIRQTLAQAPHLVIKTIILRKRHEVGFCSIFHKGQTEAETSGHREPISQIRWLADDNTSSIHRRQRLVTSGTDGRVVVWQIALSHPSKLIEPLKAVALKATDIPKDLKKNIITKGRGPPQVHPGLLL